MIPLDEAVDLIEAKYDIIEVIDILNLDSRDVLLAFIDRVREQIEDFKDIYEAFEYYED